MASRAVLSNAAMKKAHAEQKFKDMTPEEILGALLHRLFHASIAYLNLEKQWISWRSAHYDHFKPPIIINENGRIIYRFYCKR
jgi:hypothetical protein